MDDEGAKSSDEFKSSEEETGLGQGEGAKDVSDQIENEDMLDGAYQNPEDGQDKEEKENKEEDNGIEMSENFESNLQDKDEEEKGDEEEEEKEGELEDESGDVEGNEDLDKDMWGEEEEEEKEDKSELGESEEKGKAEEEKMDELAAKEDIEKSDKNDEKRQRKEEEREKENEPGKDEMVEEPDLKKELKEDEGQGGTELDNSGESQEVFLSKSNCEDTITISDSEDDKKEKKIPEFRSNDIRYKTGYVKGEAMREKLKIEQQRRERGQEKRRLELKKKEEEMMKEEEREKKIRELEEKEKLLMEKREKLMKKEKEAAANICKQQKIKIEQEIDFRERIEEAERLNRRFAKLMVATENQAGGGGKEEKKKIEESDVAKAGQSGSELDNSDGGDEENDKSVEEDDWETASETSFDARENSLDRKKVECKASPAEADCKQSGVFGSAHFCRLYDDVNKPCEVATNVVKSGAGARSKVKKGATVKLKWVWVKARANLHKDVPPTKAYLKCGSLPLEPLAYMAQGSEVAAVMRKLLFKMLANFYFSKGE